MNGSSIVTHAISGGESIEPAIVDAVAAVENSRPTDLPPLSAAVDTDALVAVVDSTDDVRVTFDYSGYRVVVTSETVELY